MKSMKALCLIFVMNVFSKAHAFLMMPWDVVLTIGAFTTNQGQTQDIAIHGLVGDRYTATKDSDQNVVVGAGVFKNLADNFALGLNVFYLAKTQVEGLVFQEHLFDNLGYRYGVTHIPLLITAKGRLPLNGSNKALTIDIGIGPNIMQTKDYRDFSRDGGITLPNNAYLSKTQTEFAASLGLGMQIDNAIKEHPINVAYRFFYLGEGQLTPRTNFILNPLKTGTNYAHAITVSTTV